MNPASQHADSTRQKAVLIRSGGLGDFILALPLLHRLQNRFASCTVFTHTAYGDMVTLDYPEILFIDINSIGFSAKDLHATFLPHIRNAVVFSFLPDPDQAFRHHLEWLGAQVVLQLQSRPALEPHFCIHSFHDAGLPLPGDWQKPSLQHSGSRANAKALWLHPGSGSEMKNAPLAWFLESVKTLAPQELILSFGDADEKLIAPATELFRKWSPTRIITPSLAELRRQLTERAATYIGNDSGVTHLAAALNIPTTAVFRNSNPGIWAPPGEQTKVVRI